MQRPRYYCLPAHATENTWSELVSASTSPKARSFAGFTSGRGNSRANSLYLFGGIDHNGNLLNDLWEYQISKNMWRSISSFLTGRAPSPRFGMGLFSDDDGQLYILGGEGASDGFRDLFKVPLPLDDAHIPARRSEFLQIYDEDTLIGRDTPAKSFNSTVLTGKISLCYPSASPVYPCTMRMKGSASGWRVMLACDGKKGCEHITLDTIDLVCDEKTVKDHPTFEVSGGASISVSDSYISGCSSKASGGFIRAFDNAVVTINSSTIHASESAESGGALAVYGSTLNVSSSFFSECRSLGGSGGTIWADVFNSLPLPPRLSSLSITDSTFSHCSSSLNGGALFSSNGALSMTHSSFDNNSALGIVGGGGICINEVDAAITFDTEDTIGEAARNNSAPTGGGFVIVWTGSKTPSISACETCVASKSALLCFSCDEGSWPHVKDGLVRGERNVPMDARTLRESPTAFVIQFITSTLSVLPPWLSHWQHQRPLSGRATARTLDASPDLDCHRYVQGVPTQVYLC
jgi:hypothetical protein